MFLLTCFVTYYLSSPPCPPACYLPSIAPLPFRIFESVLDILLHNNNNNNIKIDTPSHPIPSHPPIPETTITQNQYLPNHATSNRMT